MFYKGQIEKVNKVVVSDPSYQEGVWCRYESDKIDSGGPWRVQMAVNEVTDNTYGIETKGVEFALLLSSNLLSEKACELNKEDGSSYLVPMALHKMLHMKETEIGMDTACVALGVNEVADEIKASRDEWQPGCALKTITDGMFGNVQEGSLNGSACLLYISGYLDEDAGYSAQDIVNYLSTNFKIKDLELVKDKPALEDEIKKAKGKENINKVKNEAQKEADLGER